MFHLGKILGLLDEPLTWFIVWWAFALVFQTKRPTLARRMLWSSLAALLLCGVIPIVDRPLRALEEAYPVPTQQQLDQQVGIIVLGGSFSDPWIYQDHQQVALNASAERLTQAVYLMRQHPTWTLVFTGGEGRVIASGITEGQIALQFFKEMGVDEKRIIIEQQSRTTQENAQRVQQLLGDQCRQPWLLITSAAHMRRGLQSFSNTQCQLTPYPTDYMTSSITPWHEYSLLTGLKHLQLAMHEGMGWLYYWLVRAEVDSSRKL
jgi:uncharacterized SAM-binding protein YcdF (DUF218 family)